MTDVGTDSIGGRTATNLRFADNIEGLAGDSYSRTTKKITSHGNEVLLKDTLHLIQGPCIQQRGPR